MVEFTVRGVACIGLNGGSAFQHNEAFSFKSPPTIRTRPTATGMPSSATAARKRVRLVQRQGRLSLADHAARTDGGRGGRRRSSQTRV